MKRDIIAEGYGLFPVDRVCIGAGNVDGFPDIIDPAHIVQKTYPSVRDGIVVGGILPCPRRQTGQRIEIHDMRRGGLRHMRDADEGGGLLDTHTLAVDIARPHVADVLFARHIILRHMLHRDGGAHKALHLSAECGLAFIAGIQNDKDQYSHHDRDIDNGDPRFLHTETHPSFKRLPPLQAPFLRIPAEDMPLFAAGSQKSVKKAIIPHRCVPARPGLRGSD